MDVVEAIITALWYRIKGDAELQSIMGHPPDQEWLYLNWAEKDAPFPYMVHAIETGPQDPWAVEQARYTLDVWDYGPNQSRLLAIRSRVITLLNRYPLQIPGGEAKALRIFKGRDRPLPTDADDVHRRSMEWRFRFVAQREIEAILGRAN